MPWGTDDGRHWRDKAVEARAQAAQMTDPQARSTMLKIAESYEHLAGIAERAARTKRHIP
jgi:hypothetical protein